MAVYTAIRYQDVTANFGSQHSDQLPEGRRIPECGAGRIINQERGDRKPMHNQSVNESRFLFLEQIAIETPEAAAKLFELRDAGKWQAEYRLSADWLETFLWAALDEEQERM